ncbi:hypothetical protein, partial [Methylobacterium mesophilicum]|uniref:hypothetical protein n=1 Tax=Methylobacterium mesophilicum TaxID=39956 RepID=UPI001EE185A3
VKPTSVKGQVSGDFFDNTHFTVDWDQRRAVCPGGQSSVQWRNDRRQRRTPYTRLPFALP